MNQVFIREIMDSFYKISTDTFRQFYQSLEEFPVKKGKIFIDKGRREDHEYFVVQGICRSFLFNPEGEDITLSLFNERTVISPFVTRTRQGVSTLYFQALTDTILVRFPANEFEEFMAQNLDIRAWANEVLKTELAQKVEKEIELASLTAKERLLNFRDRFPMFENRIPHPIIASYLGITNVSLSRLRKNIH